MRVPSQSGATKYLFPLPRRKGATASDNARMGEREREGERGIAPDRSSSSSSFPILPLPVIDRASRLSPPVTPSPLPPCHTHVRPPPPSLPILLLFLPRTRAHDLLSLVIHAVHGEPDQSCKSYLIWKEDIINFKTYYARGGNLINSSFAFRLDALHDVGQDAWLGLEQRKWFSAVLFPHTAMEHSFRIGMRKWPFPHPHILLKGAFASLIVFLVLLSSYHPTS